jgi:hypothetical protein
MATRTTRERRFRVRRRRNLVFGIVAGVVLGGAAGILLGLLAFGAGTPGMWAALVAGLIFGLVLGAFEGGMAALESPEPGHEPSQTTHPVRDVPELTRSEGETGPPGGP